MLTTFKTLKTDRGIGFVTGSLIGPLAGWGRVGLVGWKPNSRPQHGRAPTEEAAARIIPAAHLAGCVSSLTAHH